MIMLLGAVGLGVLILLIAMAWRVVVPTEEAHVVQRRKKSTAYGRDFLDGNVYYNVPSAIPYFGVKVTELPTSIFSVNIGKYEAYDSARVPFLVDVISFFQIEDAVEASRRVSNMQTLVSQLQDTMRGAVRRVLASKPIETIMATRADLAAEFITEVQEQVKNWGIKTNSIEFMNIEDAPGTEVVTNIMDKERTTIEKESRMKVADNLKTAELAEITAGQEVDLRKVERTRTVALETQKANQTVKEEEAKTAMKTAEVVRVETLQAQDIEKSRAIVETEMAKEVTLLQADAKAQAMKREAEGYAEMKKLEGAGDSDKVRLIGTADADVIRAKGLADAEAKEKLAEAMTKLNDSGITVEQLKAWIAVETAKYAALGKGLEKADIKMVTSGQGNSILGFPMNAESGANLDMFLKEAGLKASDLPAKLKEIASKLIPKVDKA